MGDSRTAGNAGNVGPDARGRWSADQQHLNVTRTYLPPMEEFIAEIAPLWDTHWVTNMGDKHEQFSLKLAELLGVEHCVLFSSGHSALQSTLEALNLAGEVITTPFTFSSTTHAIVRAGLTPVMCDVKQSDGTLDPGMVESLITDRTCAILPVHVYGNVCDYTAIQSIAKRYGLKVIYDAAHAFGERVGDVSVASLGDASILSFHATKVFNSVEGGAVCFDGNALLRKTLDLLKNFGIVDEENVEAVGFNAKMSELHASMGLCNLRHHAENVESRRKAFERYRDRLGDVPGLRFVSAAGHHGPDGDQVEHNYAYCAMAVENGFGCSRDELHVALLQRGIAARKYFYPCTNAYACYAGVFDPHDTPVAKALSERVLCLPLFSGMAGDDVDRVCDAVLDARMGGRVENVGSGSRGVS